MPDIYLMLGLLAEMIVIDITPYLILEATCHNFYYYLTR